MKLSLKRKEPRELALVDQHTLRDLSQGLIAVGQPLISYTNCDQPNLGALTMKLTTQTTPVRT